MSDLLTEHRKDVKAWFVAVAITKPGEGEVFEGYRVFDAKSEKQAVAKAHNHYQDDEWEVTRLRHIKKVFDNDD